MSRHLPIVETPLCPSAEPNMPGSSIIGVVAGTAREPRVRYLDRRLPATAELLETSKPVRPTEVFRFAATCAKSACQHFDGQFCQLVAKAVAQLPAVETELPQCTIRRECRWHQQEGAMACFRCPQVVTEMYLASTAQRFVADPKSPPARQA